MKNQNVANINHMFDTVIAQQGLKNDAALSHFFKIAPPVISKTRHGNLLVGPTMILLLHEKGGLPVADIRAMLEP
jgi:hypothetical protein